MIYFYFILLNCVCTFHCLHRREPRQDLMKDSLIDSYAFLTIGLNSIPIWQWHPKCMGMDQQADKDEKFHVVLNAIKTKLY